MKRIKFIMWSLTILLSTFVLPAYAQLYGERFCSDPRFDCIRIQPGESWNSLFPDPDKQDVVKRLNRMNTPLYAGMRIAVPKDLTYLTSMDVSPFRPYIKPTGLRTIIVDQRRLAWGAYSENGELINWGPISSGKGWCPDTNARCATSVGHFYIYDKRGANCKSTKFPIGEGGAPMPYCMFFNGGFALHGSPAVPGYRASHGCVRIFNEDAKWLSQVFTLERTKVIVEPL